VAHTTRIPWRRMTTTMAATARRDVFGFVSVDEPVGFRSTMLFQTFRALVPSPTLV
jgi:hypothetical protein